MGYRSSVVLGIAPQAAHAFMALQAKNPEVMKLCNEADRFTSGYSEPGDYFMYWNGIKWYDSYPEIAAIQEFVMAMDSNDLQDYGEDTAPKGESDQWGEYFKFIRIGEDIDDVETAGWSDCFEDVYITRDINF
jgi:hypothetical protein